MRDLTLLTVNWNQQPCIELLLKSYVKHHYTGEPLRLCLVDNGSTDDSKGWLIENGIPFVDLHNNIGHENALNFVYKNIKSSYCLLNDTDIEYHANVFDYVKLLKRDIVSAGELIDNNFMNDSKVKDRISPWFWLFDIFKMHQKGMVEFRDPKCEDWSFDVGSWHWMKMKEFGFTNFNLRRQPGNQDADIVSMRYNKFDHIGKVSWNLDNHGDRYSEVMRRRRYVQERLELYKEIDLKGKFYE